MKTFPKTVVSIVSGTFNRLPLLQQMVYSVRRSLGGRIPYEIIIVDGGSTDGTIPWCGRQPDIRLIEQGELLGAVKAFNAGAEQAQGMYTILANDDIVFVGTSILRAVAYMQDHPEVGVGCFYQDREGKPWHVEQMPAVWLGRQVSTYYGQVCIVPTWLGNKVGWWGDYLHTYGGDNELSANVLEAGYRVLPISCACIHDLQAQDALRTINQGNPAAMARSGRPHPDTKKFYAKWRKNGLVGPTISIMPRWNQVVDRQRRIFYAPIYEKGHRLQHQTKTGLYRALSQQGITYDYDYMERGTGDEFYEVLEDFQPDLLVLQVQGYGEFTPGHMQQIRKTVPNAKIVTWNGDYHPENLFEAQYLQMLSMADHCGFALASEEFRNACRQYNVPWFYWQIGYEEADPAEDVPAHDIVFLGNGYSPARLKLGNYLASLRNRGVNVGIYGSWPGNISNGENLYNFSHGAGLYKKAKIAISDQQWPDATGYVSNRLFQAMAAGGALLLQQRFDGYLEWLGLEWQKHLDLWRDLQELDAAIWYWLDPASEEQRKNISNAGQAFMLENHSFDKRVEELWGILDWPY